MIDLLTSAPHYRAHALPLWNALPESVRGGRLQMDGPQFQALRHPAINFRHAVLVASFRDMGLAWARGYRRIVLMEHGTGQSYIGLNHGAYPGGPGRDPVNLFLSPNETAADHDRRAYPAARVAVIGDPRLDTLPAREGEVWDYTGADSLVRVDGPTVALSFHWEWIGRVPETRSALPHYQRALPELATRFNLIGHAHPRAAAALVPLYQRLGIEYVADFDEVCRRADVLVMDNSSALFEFASTGRPVIPLNAPWYRRDVEHGGRFWAAAGVGIQVNEPAELEDAITTSLSLAGTPILRRDDALDLAYGFRSGAAQRGADVIMEWLADIGDVPRPPLVAPWQEAFG